MILPKLDPVERDRETKKYTQEQCEEMVFEFLFNGLGYREIDRDVLNLDPMKSKGFQSMGVIHNLGLREFKGLFREKSIDEVLDEFPEDTEYDFLYEILDRCRIRRIVRD